MRNDNNANTTAYLSNKGRYTTFAFKDIKITFLTSKILERYTKILSWDNGYIEVMTRKQGKPKAEEDYIDLIPILLAAGRTTTQRAAKNDQFWAN